MKIIPRLTYQHVSRVRRLTTSIHWIAIVLGILVLGLLLRQPVGTSDDISGSLAGRLPFWLEALLLSGVLGLLFLNVLIERVRGRLENELAQNCERFQQLTDHVQEVFWWVAPPGRTILYVSPAYADIWGHSRESLYRNPQQWFESIVPEHRDRIGAELPLQPEGGYDVEYQIERPDGSRRWIHDRAFPVYRDSGEVYRLAGLAMDITERKLLAAQLMQRDRLLTMAHRMARLGSWSLNVREDRMVLSDEACAIFELPAGATLSLERALSFYPPESRGKISAMMDRCLEQAQDYDVEVQVVGAAGRSLWVRAQGHPVFDDGGQVASLEGVIQDITDRKHVASMLNQGLQRFRDFADAMPNLVWTADTEGRLDYGNRALEGFLGLDQDDALLDDRWREAIDGLDRAAYQRAWDRALGSGGRIALECQLRRFDGQLRWHSIQATPVRDTHGAVVKWYGNATNIHERKLSEQRAQALAERLAVTLESITDALFTLNRNWQITYVNREAERLLQRSRDQILRRTLWECFPGTVNTEFEQAYREAMVSGDKIRFEAFYEPLDFWARVNVYPSEEGLAIYFQDITEQKEAERKQQRIRELENFREVAEQANETKSRFLASMSHEIRTPINGIVGMVDVLNQTSLHDHQVEMVNIIRESSQSLLGIVDDILDFSKIEAGKLDLHETAFSPAVVTRSVCLLLDRMAINHDVELTLFTDPALPAAVWGDELRLRQVLLNLVNNAIKFSAQRDRLGRVQVLAMLSGNGASEADLCGIEWHVVDNGVGMTNETLSRLFNPFVQADLSTTRQYGGTGLGLSITRNLISLMGGDIKVVSEPDQGAEFRVYFGFPLINGEEQPESALPDLVGRSVWVWPNAREGRAQERACLAQAWTRYLQAAGAEVCAAPNLSVAEAESALPDLIVLDTGDANPDRAELSEKLPLANSADARWLVIGRGNRRQVRRESHGLYSLDANCLSQSNFLQAVSVALGLAPLKHARVSGRAGRTAVREFSREQAIAHGALLLVAEDNETNRKVLLQQLRLLGYTADMTSNGQDALRRWRESPGSYAAILTDLHMPELDGYGLVEVVRQAERQEWGLAGIPIIALTANALAGEAQRCRQLGMNDYLVKPVSLKGLRQALEHWCPLPTRTPLQDISFRSPSVEPISLDATDAATQAGKALDLDILRNLIGDDRAEMDSFLESFRSSSEGLVEQVVTAWQEDDWESLGGAAHSLKSSARSLGAMGLGCLCEQLESCAHRIGTETQTDIEATLADLLDDFKIEWQRVRDALQTALR